MKLPIPDDWNGQDWTCVEIQWPNSAKWLAVLAGLLSQPMRGWGWDEQTGPTLPEVSIPTVQAIAWDIWLRNQPFNSCSGVPIVTPPEPQNGLYPAFGGMEGYDDMPCIDISHLLKIEDGVLYARDSCCEWIAIGRIAGLNQSIGDDPTNPTGDPNFTYSACGKAAAIVNMVYKIIEASFDVASDPLLLPTQLIGKVEQAVGYNLDNLWLSMLVLNAAASLALSQTYDDIASGVEKQAIICQLKNMFADDASGVTSSAMFEEIKGVFRANIALLNWGWYDQSINALGTNDMNTIAKLGAADVVTNCDCPAEVAPEAFFQYGLDKAWRYVYDFRTGVLSWVLTGGGGHTQQTNAIGLWATNQITQHFAEINAYLPFDNINNGSVLELVGLIWSNIGDEGWSVSGTRIGTNEDPHIGQAEVIALGGNVPATQGTFTFIASVNDPLGVGADKFEAQLKAAHATDVSQKLIAVMFAGSGPGPMTV